MAFMNLQDVYAEDELNQAMVKEIPRKSVIIGSGIVGGLDGGVQKFLDMGEGKIATFTGYVDLDDPVETGNAVQSGTSNPAYPDDSDTVITPTSVGNYDYDVGKSMANKSVGEKEIVSRFSYLPDPMTAMNNMITRYWSKYYDKWGLALMDGVLADSIANHNSDMLAGDGTAAIDENVILDSIATMGEYGDMSTMVFICNTRVATVLRKKQLIETIPSVDGSQVALPYLFGPSGLRVIVRDDMPKMSNGTDDTFVSFVAGSNILQFGESTAGITPSEMYRTPTTANGAGERQVITRKQFAFAPRGYSWKADVVTGSTASGNLGGRGKDSSTKLLPCIADMREESNWERVLDRKLYNLSFVHSSEV